MKQITAKTEIKVKKNTAVRAVVADKKALYFSTAEGLQFRLRFEGVYGWRLQSGKNGRFDDLGASQALARFMGEKAPQKVAPISIASDKTCVVLTEKKGTQAILSLGEEFSLRFSSPEGKVIQEITSLGMVNQRMTVVGALDATEGIYGGGERLDVANKRGTSFDLYTCDGWNNSSTTYVVIPVFLTTRGGGMFFNRNETAVVDFGKADASAWSYTQKVGDLDCYFYPTGDMADALRGYTELSGHAYMPTPWMQGVHICRYRPDFTCFDKDQLFDTFEDIPGRESLFAYVNGEYVPLSTLSPEAQREEKILYCYVEKDGKYDRAFLKTDEGIYTVKGRKGNPGGRSCKTIMETFIREDMKPDAASMEPRGWANCFIDSDVSRADKADLIQSVKWLHAHGLRAMVYIRVGGVNEKNIGFREEYLVHADVEITQEDGSVMRNENTTRIPWILGTGENPDVGRRNGQMRTETFLDITSDEAIAWYFDTIWGEMIDIGVDGVKIDFCECMPDGELQIGTTKTHYKWKNPDRIVTGTEHHAYAPYFISLFYKKMIEKKAEKGLKDGFMVFVRGGGIGSQRNPYMWSGDQARSFEKLDDQLLATVNCGLSGLPYMSFDMAGYAYGRGCGYYQTSKEEESEIFARATEFTAFLTQMQTHGDVRHAFEMTEQTKQIYRNFTRLHTELVPYMQKYSKIACETGMPPVRHLVLQYPTDTKVYDLIDEFLLGEGLLVAPILTGETFAREVYLPAGEWTDLLTGEVIEGGKTVIAKANLGQIPVYLNNLSADKKVLLPIFEGQNWNQIKTFA